jgi:NADH:ubiquinone oxidoreductase subunit E
MLLTERERQREQILELARDAGRGRQRLIPILQEIKRGYGHVSEYAMQVVADALDIHPVEVHSVASFYSFLGGSPAGRFVIRLCSALSCEMAGGRRVARQLENDLGIRFGETTADGRFTLERARCLGLCDQGPAMLVNERVYTQVTPAMVHQVLEQYRRAIGAHATESDEGNLV